MTACGKTTEPKPGSRGAQILALARKKVEVSAIAERLGISGRNVNSYLRSFRAKGLLPEREAK